MKVQEIIRGQDKYYLVTQDNILYYKGYDYNKVKNILNNKDNKEISPRNMVNVISINNTRHCINPLHIVSISEDQDHKNYIHLINNDKIALSTEHTPGYNFEDLRIYINEKLEYWIRG